MKIARIFAAPAAVTLLALAWTSAGCSSSGTKAAQDPGVTGDGTGSAAASAPDKNPDGVPYPTDQIGTNSRAGNRAGDRIANFKFLGYPDGDVTKGLTPISLAQYYDPSGQRNLLIHIQASGSWCPHCEKEIEAVSTVKADLDKRKVVWLVSLAEGPTPGTPSTKADLDKWLHTFSPPYTHVLDPGNANLGPFYDAAALPWNANINAKTMEILTSQTGANETGAAILADLDSAQQLADDAAVGLK